MQRFIPTTVKGTDFTSDKTGSFTGITYSADGTKLFFSQDDNHVVIAKVDPHTGFLTNGQSVDLPPPPADGRHYHNAKSINPGGIAVSQDGRRAYVALNAANTLGVIDLADRTGPAHRTRSPSAMRRNSVVIRWRTKPMSATKAGARPRPKDFTNRFRRHA